MTEESTKSAYSSLFERLTLLMLLFAAGAGSDVLLWDFPSSATSVAYVACLALMAVATLRAIRPWDLRPKQEPDPTLTTGWHVPHTFTDPLFQLPAVFCVILLLADLTLELVAEPPQSEAGVWFLSGMAALTLGAASAIVWRSGRAGEHEAAGTGSATKDTREEAATGRHATRAFEDPWFAVPVVVAPFLLVTRELVERIEEGDVLESVTPYMVGLLVGGGAVAIAVLWQQRKEGRASVEGERQSAGVARGDRGGSDS